MRDSERGEGRDNLARERGWDYTDGEGVDEGMVMQEFPF